MTCTTVTGRPAPSESRTLRVTYVVSRWGTPTETFVRREAAAVAASGAEVAVLSLKRPRAAGPERPVVWLGAFGVARLAARSVRRSPRASWRVLADVVRGSRSGTRAARVAAAIVGLAWAQRPESSADLVHAHFGWVSATAAWAAARITQRPYSVVLHAFDLHSERVADRFSPVPLREAARVFAISERDRAAVADRWDLRVDVLRMGVDDAWLEDPPLAVSDREPWNVVAVGSLVPKKGHHVLIDALAQTHHPWRLDIVGEGPTRAGLERRIAERGLAERVRLLGACAEEEVRCRLRRASVAALACVVAPDGDRDGIPVALMEAMAAGTPVVSTRVGGIPELIEGVGLLVEPDDPDALADALDHLAEADVRRAMGVRGRRRISDHYRSSCSAARVVDVAVDQ